MGGPQDLVFTFITRVEMRLPLQLVTPKQPVVTYEKKGNG